jgi:hypothetical protein
VVWVGREARQGERRNRIELLEEEQGEAAGELVGLGYVAVGWFLLGRLTRRRWRGRGYRILDLLEGWSGIWGN